MISWLYVFINTMQAENPPETTGENAFIERKVNNVNRDRMSLSIWTAKYV